MSIAQNIVVAGAGGIGRAVAILLSNYPEFRGDIFIGDRNPQAAMEAAQWVREGTSLPVDIIPFELGPETTEPMERVFSNCSLILDCLPGSEAPRMARIALKFKMHYANLTEYVDETNEIIELAKDAETGFVLQTGLAPGFINILAIKLYNDFKERFGVEQVEHIGMRVGGLTIDAMSPHFYGFTWSPIGVTTEYVKPCIVVRDNTKQLRPALSERETLVLNGVAYEADLTSGGAADIPDAYASVARNIDYKTIRYPGHFAWVDKLVSDIVVDEEQVPEELYKKMSKVVPMVEDDVIIIYAFVTGLDKDGILRKVEGSYTVQPMQINGKTLRAIQSTTAAPLAEFARQLLLGKWKGVVLQSQVDPIAFLHGPFVESVYQKTTQTTGNAAFV